MIWTSQSDSVVAEDDSYTQAHLCLPRSLRYFLFVILGLTILSLGYSWIARWLGFGLPYSFTGLFSPRSFLSDFLEFNESFHHFGSQAFFSYPFAYPPAMALPIAAFYSMPHSFWLFGSFLLASGGFFTFCFFRILRNRALALPAAALLALGVAISSYPYMYLLQRGNTEVFIWITVTLGIWSFYRGHYTWAAICLGLATSFKLYPFIFFGLFLPHRRYREFALGVFVTVVITIIALRALSPDIAYAFAWDNAHVQAFGKYFGGSAYWLGYDHSCFGLIKLATLPWHPDLTPLLRPYTWFVAVICIALYFGRMWKLPLANQILVLSVLAVSIPPVSYEYTLLELYGSLAILCVIALGIPDEKQRELIPYFMLYALILTPENYIIIRGILFGAQFRAMCLLALLILALRKPLPTKSDLPLKPEAKLHKSPAISLNTR
jgi:hypothetical protein